MSNTNTFTYNPQTQSCSECGSKDVVIKTSKNGNKPYLVNGDKSYHRTYGTDGQMHCAKNKSEYDWIKDHPSYDGFTGGGGNTIVYGNAQTGANITTTVYQKSQVVDSIGMLDVITQGELLMRDTCERFTIIMYPIAIANAKKIVDNQDAKDTRICAMGLMHDYSVICAQFIERKFSSMDKSESVLNTMKDIENLEK